MTCRLFKFVYLLSEEDEGKKPTKEVVVERFGSYLKLSSVG